MKTRITFSLDTETDKDIIEFFDNTPSREISAQLRTIVREWIKNEGSKYEEMIFEFRKTRDVFEKYMDKLEKGRVVVNNQLNQTGIVNNVDREIDDAIDNIGAI